ncbi:putative Fructose-bisphosphate aldolase class-I-containing protein [Homarus americanus]|uniref:fructose-bisphosphate aldolase n=1 Tax=Homarus americanus TaxID=6706 RepID=A0A8J5JSA2_HOMAM|nr:putative Fructose-bisphosphate aldolase class-I-containing protein [Homarus americanus]
MLALHTEFSNKPPYQLYGGTAQAQHGAGRPGMPHQVHTPAGCHGNSVALSTGVAVPTSVSLSGGQSEEEATVHLDTINKCTARQKTLGPDLQLREKPCRRKPLKKLME